MSILSQQLLQTEAILCLTSYDEVEKEVHVVLQGACSGCPSSTFTLKNGIETMLKEMMPGKIATVIAVNG